MVTIKLFKNNFEDINLVQTADLNAEEDIDELVKRYLAEGYIVVLKNKEDKNEEELLHGQVTELIENKVIKFLEEVKFVIQPNVLLVTKSFYHGITQTFFPAYKSKELSDLTWNSMHCKQPLRIMIVENNSIKERIVVTFFPEGVDIINKIRA